MRANTEKDERHRGQRERTCIFFILHIFQFLHNYNMQFAMNKLRRAAPHRTRALYRPPFFFSFSFFFLKYFLLSLAASLLVSLACSRSARNMHTYVHCLHIYDSSSRNIKYIRLEKKKKGKKNKAKA